MRIKSAAGKDVYFEYWSTPLDKAKSLWLSSVLQTINKIHFFFRFNTDLSKKIHVLTINRLSPYRLIEERYAVGCVDKNLETKKKKKNEKSALLKGFERRTWKLWGTQFIKEVDENTSLSNYSHTPDKTIVQYLIRTNDEYIEFITRQEPKWKSYPNSKLEDLLIYYAEDTRDK